jgi:D-aspartate ligase
MNKFKDATKPVVVFRSGHHGGLGIVRSLGRLGVPLFCVDADRWEPAFSSRYCRGRFVLKAEDNPDGGSVDQLLEIGRKLGGHPILIPTTDHGTMWVADHAEALRQEFCFPLQEAALIRALCDKSRMQELARKSGVPTAQSAVPTCKQDVERFLDTAVFPVMVKAADAERVRARLGGTKFVVRTPRELLDLYAKADDPSGSGLLLQEFIPGEDWMFDGYFDRDSRCLFGVTGKKLRRFPVQTGVTSLGVCLRNDAVERTTIAFMQAIGYRGILDIGYRHDQRDGQYKVLDVNPRIGCTFRLLASSDGMDAARALYLNLTSQAFDRSAATEGRKWIVEDFDLVSAFRSWRNGGLSVKDWVRSLRGIEESACFALDDPVPFLLMPIADICELTRWLRSGGRASWRRPARLQADHAG